ncbi:MAG: TIGR04255 family protein [Actinobacteria bacterium]|uniref:Unannotated protein n=1 Tax=freshwater metagenome TaxID=449393 RepID=A0A6J6EFA4_9ZZZZ|nr:TIGR04255 family protein [Actinomycetota bacterium]
MDPAPFLLPRFQNPPLDEVAIGLLFDRLEGFTDLHAGLFWRSVKGEYPRSLSRPRVDEEAEVLSGSPLRRLVLPSFGILEPGDSIGIRTWLVSADDSLLLQIQDTHFLRNWRKRDSFEYPHHESFRAGFWDAYDRFLELLDEEAIERPKVRQVEISYFNWITDDIDFFVPGQALRLSDPGLSSRPELLSWKSTFLDHVDGAPVGRLWIELQPGARKDARQEDAVIGYRLSITYRAPLDDPDRDRIDSAVSRGRELIDRTFLDVTSVEAQERWGRIQ